MAFAIDWLFAIQCRFRSTGQHLIQLTDGLNALATGDIAGGVYGVIFSGRRYDTGDRLDYLKAIVQVATSREDLGPDFLAWLRQFMATH